MPEDVLFGQAVDTEFMNASNYNLVENERCRLMDAYLERYCRMLENLFNKQVLDDTEYDKYNAETFGQNIF
jgi:hypothetical protein